MSAGKKSRKRLARPFLPILFPVPVPFNPRVYLWCFVLNCWETICYFVGCLVDKHILPTQSRDPQKFLWIPQAHLFLPEVTEHIHHEYHPAGH